MCIQENKSTIPKGGCMPALEAIEAAFPLGEFQTLFRRTWEAQSFFGGFANQKYLSLKQKKI